MGTYKDIYRYTGILHKQMQKNMNKDMDNWMAVHTLSLSSSALATLAGVMIPVSMFAGRSQFPAIPESEIVLS